MKAHTANLINGIILVLVGLWGYFASETPSPTALIAPAFGLIFILATPMVKKENKVVAHIVVLLTLLLIIALIMPLMAREGIAQIRIIIMILSSVMAMVYFIKSFRDARIAREAGNS